VPVFERVLITMSPARKGNPSQRELSSSVETYRTRSAGTLEAYACSCDKLGWVTKAVTDVRGLLAEQIDVLAEIASGLSDNELVRPSGCEGWTVADLVIHLRMDCEGLLSGLASPTEIPADRDHVSYWKDWPPLGPATFSEVRWIWAMSAAYATGDGLRRHFCDIAGAAASASRHVSEGRILFQGHSCEVDEFLTMWVVEFALHQIDLVVGVDDRPDPPAWALEVVLTTLDALIGHDRPAWWDERSFLLKATGRERLSSVDRERLGEQQHLYPAFG
jgi:Mycothiol maleylpyruvate isomerase N-terminal domain